LASSDHNELISGREYREIIKNLKCWRRTNQTSANPNLL